MKQKLLLAFLLLVSVCFLNAQTKLVEKVTKKANELVIPYEKYVLSNGLTLIVHEDHSDPIVHVDVTYHVGSAREEIGKSGFAHFFEHMMFQGSDHVGDDQHFKIVSDAGGTLNGSTTQDRTNYYQTVPTNQLEKMLWLEADRMGFLLDAVTQKKFENQRSTVKNERGQRVDNVPYGLRFEKTSEMLYPYGHPYSWPVIGYIEDLNRSDVNDLKNFFLRWYGPNNATLTIGGDVRAAEVVKLAEKYFGAIPSGPAVTPTKVSPIVLAADRYASIIDNYAKSPRLFITYPTVPNYHKDLAAIDCFAEILGQSKNSILYQTIVKQKLGLVASVSQINSELDGILSVTLAPVQGKTLSEMEKLYRDALDAFEKRGVTDEDLAKFKGGYESQFIGSLQSVSGKVRQLAAYQTFTGNPNMIAKELQEYLSVTKEDVMRVYEKYVRGKGAVVLSVVPKGQETQIVAADNYKIDQSNYVAPDYGYAGLKYIKAKDGFDRGKMPKEGPPPTTKVPSFWRKDTPAGVKMIGTENSEVPSVTVTITIPGGHLLQARDLSKLGLASLFATMMNEDTKNYTAEKMSAELDKLGSTLSVTSSVDGINFNVTSLKKNLDATLTLLEERMFRPNFSEEAFSRNKKQALEAFKQAKSRATTVANVVFAKLNYGPNNILGMSQSGTEETVSNITLADVQSYYDNNMTSQGTKVVVIGDVSEKDIVSKLSFLDKLPHRKINLPKADASPQIDKTKVYMVDIPKSAQSEFRVGYATGLKYDATGEYNTARLMNYTLGGDFNSRINLNLREDKGWTYGARTRLLADEYDGRFEFSSGIRADATDSALAEVMNELHNYAANGISETELKFMKNSIGQREAISYESPTQKSQFIRRILDYNLPANYIDQQNKILAKITKEEIDASAKKYIRPDKLNILLVGDKAKIYEGVKKLGYPIIELDVDGKPIEKKGF